MVEVGDIPGVVIPVAAVAVISVVAAAVVLEEAASGAGA